MLSVVLLSVSVAFASDNVTDTVAIDEESQFDESLAVEEDPSIVSDGESAVVTKDNFNEYFNKSGELLKNVTANELKFSGNISDVGVNTIILNRAVNITGDGILNNISIYVNSSNVVISNITINQNKETFAIVVDNASDVEINTVNINFNAAAGSNGYAIVANLASNLKLLDNTINYVGATTGWEVNNVIRAYSSNNTRIAGNKIIAKLVSSAVGWAEVPAGSGNWVSSPISEGIVIEDSDSVKFMHNKINVTYSKVVGSYDTIYTVDFKNSNNAYIGENEINSVGNTYIYGIIITGDDFTISSNDIASLNNNTINVTSKSSVYGIYSGMNGQNTSVEYYNNNITGNAYNVFGMSIGDVNSTIYGTQIDISGNYTTGIAYRGNNLTLEKNHIVLQSSQQGNESIWEGFGVETVGVKVIKGYALIKNNTIAGNGKGLHLASNSQIRVEDNFFNVVGNDDKDAYAIYATNVPDLLIVQNHIDYQGTTNLTGINNAIYLNNASRAVISENRFDLDLVSAFIDWVEIPAGSYNYVPYIVSEGIVIVNSNNITFGSNNVTVDASSVAGAYDTIYTIDVKNSNNAIIANNNIKSTGKMYVYGIVVSGDEFEICSNNITSLGEYYANGIDIEGPASGLIEDNTIVAIAGNLSYPVYGAMSNGAVSAEIIDNEINGSAYLVYGIQLAGDNVTVSDNIINVAGNHTVGIGSRVKNIIIDDNEIVSNASNEGNLTIWDSMGTNTEGILIAAGDAVITDNDVTTTGDEAINSGDSAIIIENNDLIAKNATGSDAIKGSNVNELEISTSLKTILVGFDLTKVYGDGSQYIVKVLDENAKPIVGKVITATINNQTLTAITDSNGFAKFDINLVSGNYTVKASFAGTVVYSAKNTTNTITVTPKPTAFTAPDTSLLVTATNSGASYRIILKDDSGNVLANKNVTIVFDGKTSVVATDANGTINYNIVAAKEGSYALSLSFTGDDKYAASAATATIKVNKEATKLTAAKKTYKAKVKTKKYTATLKDSNGKVIKGVKLTLKVKGKTYRATTNAKGKAVFKIKNLKKKGTYKATVKFAGNNLYKASSKTVKIKVKK